MSDRNNSNGNITTSNLTVSFVVGNDILCSFNLAWTPSIKIGPETIYGSADLENDDWISQMRRGILPIHVVQRIISEIEAQGGKTTADEVEMKFRQAIEGRLSMEEAIDFEISSIDQVRGRIINGDGGVIQRVTARTNKDGNETEDIETILIFRGKIGPVIMIDGSIPGVQSEINGEKRADPLEDFLVHLSGMYRLSAGKAQHLREVIDAFILGSIKNGEFVEYASSPISVKDDIIRVDFERKFDLSAILKAIRDFHDQSSNPLGFRTVFAWSLVAPLHNELKRRSRKGIQTPQIIETGKTKAGKTSLGYVFLGRGYNMDQDLFFYPYNRVRTPFTFMYAMSQTNLPALIDDLPPNWVFQHKEDLKAYAQTGHFGDRGRGDQTVTQYRGSRSFIGTINDDIRMDDDLALSARLIILAYTEQHRLRKNREAYATFMDTIPEGFMFKVFQAVFENKNISDVLKDVERFEEPGDWINWGIRLINALLKKYSIPALPAYEKEEGAPYFDNAYEIAQAFLGEWERIKANEDSYVDRETDETVKSVKYRSPIEGEFKIELDGLRWKIWFTGGAFKTLTARQQLRIPYSNATNFLNNVQSSDDGVKVENEGKNEPKKIGNIAKHCFCISIPAEEDLNA
ncbi:MAG: hypothetical protein QXU18_12055 [Thermoplasmatales archaeon]